MKNFGLLTYIYIYIYLTDVISQFSSMILQKFYQNLLNIRIFNIYQYS